MKADSQSLVKLKLIQLFTNITIIELTHLINKTLISKL